MLSMSHWNLLISYLLDSAYAILYIAVIWERRKIMKWENIFLFNTCYYQIKLQSEW